MVRVVDRGIKFNPLWLWLHQFLVIAYLLLFRLGGRGLGYGRGIE